MADVKRPWREKSSVRIRLTEQLGIKLD